MDRTFGAERYGIVQDANAVFLADCEHVEEPEIKDDYDIKDIK